MPTYMFRNVETGEIRRATAHAQNAARDMIPDAYDKSVWPKWECWEGGQCVWHCTEDGILHNGPRPALPTGS
jgi:hypothetical protein